MTEILITKRRCIECDEQLEISDFDRYNKELPESVQLFCPKCQFGCGMIETTIIVQEMFLHRKGLDNEK